MATPAELMALVGCLPCMDSKLAGAVHTDQLQEWANATPAPTEPYIAGEGTGEQIGGEGGGFISPES